MFMIANFVTRRVMHENILIEIILDPMLSHSWRPNFIIIVEDLHRMLLTSRQQDDLNRWYELFRSVSILESIVYFKE